MTEIKLSKVEELLDDLRQGKMIILMDDEDRENEGDLIMPASMVRPEDINFMATHARGLICLTLTKERCEQLALPLMVNQNSAQYGTNFTLSIEAAEGVTTGISAADRAQTVQAAVRRDAKPTDIVQPGHIFPLMAKPGGVLHRAGHTEAGCDLARLAGFEAAAVIVEIMNEDGTMARRQDLERFAERHELKLGTIADLIQYRTLNEKTIVKVREETIESEFGEFQFLVFKDLSDEKVHMALVKGDLTDTFPDTVLPLVRVHVADVFRDLLGAKVNGVTGWSLPRAMEAMAKEEKGVVLLLAQELNSEILLNRIEGFFTKPKDVIPTTKDGTGIYRTIGAGSQILRELGVTKMRLLSSKMKFNALSGFGLEIVEYIEPRD